MEVFRTLAAFQQAHPDTPTVCALGMFDGVHTGHQVVCESAVRQGKLLGCPALVFSFTNHPQSVLSQTPTLLLSSLEDRLAQFEALGFDYAVMIDFDASLKNRSAQNFVEDILVDHFHAQHVSVGYDYRFGNDRQGNGLYLQQSGERLGFTVQIIDPVKVHDQIVSSTLIRKLLTHGVIEEANPLLGRLYPLTGTVIQGVQRGQQLGFPTANLAIDTHRVIPATGTYGGVARLNGVTYKAVCNIGLSPTFGDVTEKRVEVHLIGYNGPSFYGDVLTFCFAEKIRDEQQFSSVEALIRQIAADCRQVEAQSLDGLTRKY